MTIAAAGEDRKVAVFGALDYVTGQIVWRLSPPKDGKAFAAFLDHLVPTLPEGPLVVVLDNVGYHKGRLARLTCQAVLKVMSAIERRCAWVSRS